MRKLRISRLRYSRNPIQKFAYDCFNLIVRKRAKITAKKSCENSLTLGRHHNHIFLYHIAYMSWKWNYADWAVSTMIHTSILGSWKWNSSRRAVSRNPRDLEAKYYFSRWISLLTFESVDLLWPVVRDRVKLFWFFFKFRAASILILQGLANLLVKKFWNNSTENIKNQSQS